MITNGKISAENFGDYSELHCPRCGSINLHQSGAIFYERGEDAKQTTKITVSDFSTKTEVVGSKDCGNPSSRRDGMTILFRCEICSQNYDQPPEIELTIAQHKGSTLLAWRYPPREEK